MGSSVCLKRKQKVSISNHCKNKSLIVLINQMLIAFKFQSALSTAEDWQNSPDLIKTQEIWKYLVMYVTNTNEPITTNN